MPLSRTVTSLHSTNLSTPDGTYIYSLIRSSPTGLSAISSDDSLRIFDSSTLTVQSAYYETHTGGVTCLRPVDENTGIVATGGRDGAVKIWDSRASGNKCMRTLETGASIPIISLDVKRGDGILTAGTERPEHSHVGGDVLIWDLRTSDIKVRYTESHNDDVTDLRFHPTEPYLLSASVDSLVNIYNLLTPPSTDASKADDDVDEALYRVINHGSSVHHAGFIYGWEKPQQRYDIYAISHDEILGVYRFGDTPVQEDNPGSSSLEKDYLHGDYRNTGCEYVVDILGNGLKGGYIAAGNHTHQTLDLVHFYRKDMDFNSWKFDNPDGTYQDGWYGLPCRLTGAHGGEIIRSVLIDHEGGSIFTAGEDGKVMAWRIPGEDQEGTMPAKGKPEESVSKKEKKDKKKKDEKKQRYAPY